MPTWETEERIFLGIVEVSTEAGLSQLRITLKNGL
jgi:hypothetical protein